MVLRFILTDSQPGKCIFDQFPTRFQDFGTFPRRLHGLEARYLSGLRPGRPNSDKSGFPGRTEKLRAEKSCTLMVVSHRVLHLSSLLCPFKIVDVQLILLISGASHLRIRPSECSLNLATNRMSGIFNSKSCSRNYSGNRSHRRWEKMLLRKNMQPQDEY